MIFYNAGYINDIFWNVTFSNVDSFLPQLHAEFEKLLYLFKTLMELIS